MDQALIKKYADNLEDVLNKNAPNDHEVRNLLEALSDLIKLAQAGSITIPIEFEAVVGGYYFTEGNLRRYRDIEEAYAAFKIEITGGETPALRALRAAHARKP